MSSPDQLPAPWKKAQNGAIWCYLAEAPADVQALFPRPDINTLPKAESKVHNGMGYTLKIYDDGKTLKVYRWTPTRGGGKGKYGRVTLKRLISCKDIIEANNTLAQLQGIVGCIHTDGTKFVLGVYEELKDQ